MSLNNAFSQINLNKEAHNETLQHGIEQFQQEHYSLASATLRRFLNQSELPPFKNSHKIYDADRQQARFLMVLSDLKMEDKYAVEQAEHFIKNTANKAQKQRVSFALAQYFFNLSDFQTAIKYYEQAGLENLTNEEIMDAKFELAYSYFINKDFDKSKRLFANIKELTSSKYYAPSNYYYGLLAYNDRDFDMALKSFARVSNDTQYKDVVPYYETEIYYFKGDYDKVIQNANVYLNRNPRLYYDKELRLLKAQTLFEQRKYQEALPLFEEYYNNSEQIRKEELYEFAYCYYKLEKYNQAIDKFQPLSESQDSLGQTSMYLLGDCYLQLKDKKGARNAFGICSDMNYNLEQKEAATFLYAKLSYELGYDDMAARKFNSFIKEYPNAQFNNEARTLLTSILAKSSNYKEAINILSEIPSKDQTTRKLYQQVLVGRGLQLMQEADNAAAKDVFNLSLNNNVDPNLEAVAYFWLSEINYKANNYNEAAQYAEKFIAKAKGKDAAIRKISSKATIQNAQINLGYAAMKTEDYKTAQTAFEEAQAKSASYTEDAAQNAIVRNADAAFLNKEFDKALGLYNKVIAQNKEDVDYAKYQKAIILGIQNKNSEKIELLKSIINKPNNPYAYESKYELGNAYLESDDATKAIPIFKELVDQKSSSATTNAKGTTLYKLAYAYQEQNNNAEAIKNYEAFIAQYPLATERTPALEALRALYVQEAKPEGYAAFLKKQNIATEKELDIEATYYDAADNEFSNMRYAQAIGLYTKYLDQYPNGAYANQALYYRGESYFQQKTYGKALTDFEKVLEKDWNNFSQNAAERAADIALFNKNYTKAESYYQLLASHGVTVNTSKTSLGLTKTSFEQKDYNNTITYADRVINAAKVDEFEKAEALLYKAKALYASDKKSDAITIFKQLDKTNAGKFSAEARYRIAEDLFLNKKYTEAETAANHAFQSSSGEEYWVIKNYILLADILTETKDYFNAKATLQSIVDNASDKDLKAEATEKLKRVKSLEKSKTKLAN